VKERDPSIFDEWERIVFRERRRNGAFAADAEQAWAFLWQKHVDNGALAETNLDDAKLICTLGWSLAMEAKDYTAAVARINTWFSHPAADSADSIDTECNRGFRALANLVAGSLVAAICEYRDLLENPQKKWPRLNRSIVRNDLCRYCYYFRRRKRVPRALAELAVETILQYPGRKRVARGINLDTVTHRQLFEALDTTYPAPTE